MRLNLWPVAGPVLCWTALVGIPAQLCSQQPEADETIAAAELPQAPQPQETPAQPKSQDAADAAAQTPAPAAAAADSAPKPLPQPKRILGLMPNYRAVSAGTMPPPPTSREAFGIATQNSFDYSAFIFVGVTSLLAKADDAWPQLGKGVDGYWAYYWRGFVDKTDGNYWVDWAMPTVLHQDTRYFAMGQGGIVKRSVYAATRVLITPNYHGKNVFNASEIFGRGASQAISITYYPSKAQSGSAYSEKLAYAIGRDALANVFRELWPDINQKLFHRHR